MWKSSRDIEIVPAFKGTTPSGKSFVFSEGESYNVTQNFYTTVYCTKVNFIPTVATAKFIYSELNVNVFLQEVKNHSLVFNIWNVTFDNQYFVPLSLYNSQIPSFFYLFNYSPPSSTPVTLKYVISGITGVEKIRPWILSTDISNIFFKDNSSGMEVPVSLEFLDNHDYNLQNQLVVYITKDIFSAECLFTNEIIKETREVRKYAHNMPNYLEVNQINILGKTYPKLFELSNRYEKGFIINSEYFYIFL